MSMKETYESPKPDNLFAANQVMPVVTGEITLDIDFVAKRGMLLDKSGLEISSIENLDAAYGVAAEDGNGGETIAVYLTGEFNASALNAARGATVFNGGEIIANRIFIKKNQEA